LRSAFLESILTDSRYTTLLAGGRITIAGAWFPWRIDLSDTSLVASSVYIQKSRFDARLDLSHADVKHNLGLQASALRGGVNLSAAHVGGSVFLRGSSFSDVDLTAAKVSGDVAATERASIRGRLNLDGAQVGGPVFLRGSSFGNVDLTDAKVGGIDATERASIRGRLNLDGAQVGGPVVLRGSSFADVKLVGARVDGQVTAGGASFRDLSLDNVQIGGPVILGRGSSFANCKLYAVHVGGGIDLSGGRYSNNGLRIAASTIDGTFKLSSKRWGKPKWADEARLDLTRTTVGGIDDDEQAWPEHLQLAGFVYKEPFGEERSPDTAFANRPVGWYLKWLSHSEGYARQPYEQLQETLQSVGRTDVASAIRVAAKDREYEGAHWPSKALGYAHKWTVGYGHHPEQAILWALGLIGIGWLVALALPRDPKAPSRLVLSAQRLIPLVDFGKGYSEVDTTSASVPRWVRLYFHVHAILGYILAGFLLAALARLTTT
jgi:uncharacterized protein YjbI with pentapeptide repeats